MRCSRGRRRLPSSCWSGPACLNVCPVYERVGGHAYGSVYPGPIGAVLTPLLAGMHARDPRPGRSRATDPIDTLPYASTLCGACYDVCPVKIDIPTLLVHLRARHVDGVGSRHRLPYGCATTPPPPSSPDAPSPRPGPGPGPSCSTPDPTRAGARSPPSATSDIELNRVEGVHGPRTLDVVLVSGAPR